MFNSTFLFMKIEFFIFTTQKNLKFKLLTLPLEITNISKKHLIFVIYVILDTKNMKTFFK